MGHAIHLVGLNHRTAAVEIREQFSLADFCGEQNWAIPGSEDINESLILSTCNRVEILTVGQSLHAGEQAVAAWAKACGHPVSSLTPYIYKLQDQTAVSHLFSVASSLDSLVLGEPQILGQLKEAYRLALTYGKSGPVLNRLLHKAFSVAKRVRTETAIAASAVSVSYAAVELAKRIFEDIHKHDVLIIGAGEMAELAGLHLVQAGVRKIRVANRTPENAKALAGQIGGEVVSLKELDEVMLSSDIIITSTGSPHPIIFADQIKKIMARRKQRPMFIIDIAIPRDVEPAVNTIDNVYLYDIDDLKEVVEENVAQRREEAEKAKVIVDEETKAFYDWMNTLELHPTIAALVQRGEKIMQEELSLTYRRLGDVDERTKEALEIMASSIIRRFNHEPIDFLKTMHKPAEDAYRMYNIDTIQRVFKLKN